ncbi:MAG: aminotransferase class I/II-fold pyridoxal phosphate-dependent enzyme [Patescibacteria group bacterium]
MNNYFRRVISASLSPNTEADDVWQAVSALFTPRKWRRGEAIDGITRWLCAYNNAKQVLFFNSGRSALLAILKAFDIGVSDEVIIQAFTCVAVPNSVLWAGATPIYADIDGTYNLDPKDVEKKITKKTKAIIVQHTFGIPADVAALQTLAKKYNVLLIEDCAHALGGVYKGKKLGSFGDAAFYSFGRDKALSSVWGGAAMIRGVHITPNEKMKKYHAHLPVPGVSWILQQLLHPIAFSCILPLYTLGLGKVLLVVLQKLRLLSVPVYTGEKFGAHPKDFPAQYPNALASLLLLQLTKLDRYTRVRQQNAQYYTSALAPARGSTVPAFIPGAAYLRYPVLVDKPEELCAAARKHGILLGNWYHNNIDPAGVDFRAVGYTVGSCPRAEDTARHIINLPTRIHAGEAKRVAAFCTEHV